MQRGVVEEAAGRSGGSHLEDRQRRLDLGSGGEGVVGGEPIELADGRPVGAQLDGPAQDRGEPGVDSRIVALDRAPVREGDGHRRRPIRRGACPAGAEPEQQLPAAGVLCAGYPAGGSVDHGVTAVPLEAVAGELAGRQVLAEHGLDRIPPQNGHGS